MRTLLLLLVAAVAAHPRRSLDVKTQLCGSKLADVLSLVCEPYGGLNGPSNTADLYTSGIIFCAFIRYRLTSQPPSPILLIVKKRGDFMFMVYTMHSQKSKFIFRANFLWVQHTFPEKL